MTRSKKIYFLLGTFGVVCAATIGVMQIEEHKEKIEEIEGTILEIDSSLVTGISWENDSEALSFKKEDVWKYEGDEAFPVDEEKINELLSWFEAFKTSFTIEEAEDLSLYGLDAPVCTIKLSSEEQSYEIKLGDYSKMDSKRYVSIGDGNVYLASEDPFEDFETELKDMIENDEVPRFSQAEEIIFEGTESYDVFYEEDSSATYCKEDVYFTETDGEKKPLSTSGVNAYLDHIADLELADYVTYRAGETELSQYGLDSPELTVTVKGTAETGEEEESVTLSISRDPEERKEQEAKEEAEGQKDENQEAEGQEVEGQKAEGQEAKAQEAETQKAEDQEAEGEEEIIAYARVGESEIIYQISADDYKSLMAASYNDLRHREVLTANFSDITQMDISMDGEAYTIASEKKGKERTYSYEGEELDIAGLQSAIEALRADRFSEEEPSGKEEIRLTVSLDNENYPQVSLVLYRYDGEDCLAVVDGQTVGFVKRSQVVDLMEAIRQVVL